MHPIYHLVLGRRAICGYDGKTTIWVIRAGGKKSFQTGGYGGKKDLTATDDHRAAWREVFSQPIPGGPVAAGFDEFFGTDVPN